MQCNLSRKQFRLNHHLKRQDTYKKLLDPNALEWLCYNPEKEFTSFKTEKESFKVDFVAVMKLEKFQCG